MTKKSIPTSGVSKKTETLQWQKTLRPWMQIVISSVIIFFLVASGLQIIYLHKRIERSPKLLFEFSPKVASSFEVEKWRNLALLEAHSISQRYHQANVILMSRIWTKYMGFVTGMIIAVVGAVFILGKLREKKSDISAKTALWKINIASTSPGLVMVILGTALMITTILTHRIIEVKEEALYVGTLPQVQISTKPSSQQPNNLDGQIGAFMNGTEKTDSTAKGE